MGGRGASSGISKHGKKYGTQYKTIIASGNIKFVQLRKGAQESLLETRTKGRVYVLVGVNGPKGIMYYDNNLKRSKRIDLDHSHNGMKPHTQHGYYGNDSYNGKFGATKLTTKEKKMVARVKRLWDNYTRNKK